jgi:ABC-type maltose transport system permease subunit
MFSPTAPAAQCSTLLSNPFAKYFSLISAGGGETAAYIRPLQTESLLLALPVEILFYLMQKMDGFTQPYL